MRVVVTEVLLKVPAAIKGFYNFDKCDYILMARRFVVILENLIPTGK